MTEWDQGKPPLSYRSIHFGLTLLIKSIFQSRLQRLMLVSRWIASATMGCSSHQTSLVTRYFLVNFDAIPSRCWNTRSVRLLVTPVYSVPKGLLAKMYT